MIRTKIAKKILTKKEQRHLTESGIHSIAAMKRQIAFMKKEKHPPTVCSECFLIAKKLEIWGA